MQRIYFTGLIFVLVGLQISVANKIKKEDVIKRNGSEKYCQIQSKYCKSDFHPLCEEPAQIFKRPNAIQIEFLELNDTDKGNLLMEINKFRNKLAAGAIAGFNSGSNFRIVKWSSQFAKMAEANEKYNSFCNKISIDNSEFLDGEEFLDEDNVGPNFYKNAVTQKVLDSYENSLWNTLFRAEFNRIGCALSNDRSDNSYKLFCYTNRNDLDDVTFDVVKAYKRGISCTECGEAKCHKKLTNLCDVSENLKDPDDLEQIFLNYDILDDEVDVSKIQPNTTEKYCQIQDKYCGIDLHPLCKEPAKAFLRPNAVNIEFRELSDADKSYILLKINNFRNKLAAGTITGHKSSSNIRFVNWSPQFAKLAEANDKYNSFCNKISLNNSEFVESEEFLDEDNVGPDFYKNAVKRKVVDSYDNSLWNTLFRAEFNRIGCAWSNDKSDNSYKLFCYTNRNEVTDDEFDVVKAYNEGKPCTECGKLKCHKKFTNLCDVDPDENLPNINVDMDDDEDDVDAGVIEAGIPPNVTKKYCVIQSKYCKSDFHPLCQDPAKIFLRPDVEQIKFLKLSDSDKTSILLEINKFRNKLATGAITGYKSGSNFKIVNWSPQFAKLAEANDKYNSFCNKISLNNSEFVESEEFLDEDNVGPDFYKNAVKRKVVDSYDNSLWNTLFRAEFNRIGCAWSNDKSDNSYKLFCYTNRNEVTDDEFDVVKAYNEGEPCTECGKLKCHKKFTNLCDVDPDENLPDINVDVDDDEGDVDAGVIETRIPPNVTEKYCVIQSKYCKSDFHPLCQDPAKIFLRPDVAQIKFLKLSDSDKTSILLEINKFRHKLAAGAITGYKSGSNFQIVNWSPQFAKLAEANDKYNSFCNKISLNNSEFLEGEEFLDEDRNFYKTALIGKVNDSYGNSVWNTLFRAEFNRIGCALSHDKSDDLYKLFCYTNRNWDIAYKEGKSCTQCGGAKCHVKFNKLCDIQDPDDIDLINKKLLDIDVDLGVDVVDEDDNKSNLILLYILIGLAVFIVVIILIFLFFCLRHHMKESGESYEIKQKRPKRIDMFAD